MTRVRPPRTFRRRRWFWGVYILFILLLFETGARFYWCSYGWLNFYNVPSRLMWVFYPEFRNVIRNDVLNYDADYKILLLGGSSVLPPWGAIEQVLRERLTNATGRPVRIDNLGGEGHTTRDSLIKYRHLNRHRYDLVIVYDGINDCRTNNVPAGIFKSDYSHYAWYYLVNREDRVGGRQWSAIPFTISYMWARMFSGHFLPVEMPSAEMLRYGEEIKSRGPFKENLREILDIAGRRGEPVMLMTFATWMPENYSHELFTRKMLDYTLHSVATQLWGSPPFVAKGVAEHNGAIRELAGEMKGRPEVLFVDQANLIPGEGKYYNDICHFTVAGSEKWVENAMPPILKLLEKKKLPPLATKNAQTIAPDQINMEL
ncbi:GDSL-type esterase/lipase family protein [bacterium]|nr:GDSL-type esterase/lipase family protein [bacterium]